VRLAIALIVILVASACGATAKPKQVQRRAAVPDVRGLNAPEAAARLLRAHYCVRLERTNTYPKPPRAEVPVVRQSPAAGARPRPWSIVILTIALPPDTTKSYYGIDIAGADSAPCPPIETSG
jgi:beta-lactam-binding protein with PASTA domain